jgi:hypothetical protein
MNRMNSHVCLAALLAALCAFPVAAAQEPLPSREKLMAGLRPEHPRLLMARGGFAELRDRVDRDPHLQGWTRKLEENARNLLGTPASRYEIPDGLRLLATSRRVVDRVYTLSLACRLTGEPAFKDRAWQELAAAAAFPDWNPKHFLDTAEMTHAFAIGYDWLYDLWTEEQRSVLRQAIIEKGFTPALTVYRKDSGWARSTHNWNQVCNGGLGIGALAIGDEAPEPAGEILESALRSLPRAMAKFAPDGAWNEGPGYWNYATSYNVVFLAALHTALGTDFGLDQANGFADTGLFPIYLTGPLGRTFNYADGGDRAIRAPQLFWLAERFKQPALAAYQVGMASGSAQDLVWFRNAVATAAISDLPPDRYFRDSEVVTFRSAWGEPKALFVGFKAGDNKANHSHLDLGSFVLDALGVRWAVDLGADDYNLPGYFGAQRWEYYRLRAEGQNTLVVGDTGPGQDPGAATQIVKFDSRPERAFAIADLTAAYRPAATRVRRGVALLERTRVLVQDEIETPRRTPVWWFMHTAAEIQLEPGGRTAWLRQNGQALRAQLLSPEAAVFESRGAAPLPGSPAPLKQAANEGVRKLTVHLAETEGTRLAVLLEPVPGPAAKPTEPPRVQALESW